MHRYTLCYTNADGCNFSITLCITKPDARAITILLAMETKIGKYIDKRFLDHADKVNNLISVSQLNDWIANQLTFAMPCNFSSAINIDHRSSVAGAFVLLGSTTSGVDAGMLEQNPLRMDYQLKYEQIVTDYNHAKDRTAIENTFRDLVALARTLDDEQRRATRECRLRV